MYSTMKKKKMYVGTYTITVFGNYTKSFRRETSR